MRASVVNAGDGTHEHPTQGLLDLLTLRDNLGDLIDGQFGRTLRVQHGIVGPEHEGWRVAMTTLASITTPTLLIQGRHDFLFDIDQASGEIVAAMDRGLLDAAEFNNASSDRLLGFADVSKVCMLQSFHQNAEQFEISFNKTKFDALPVPGGLMRSNIPSFRLPEKVLNEEIDMILGMGRRHFCG